MVASNITSTPSRIVVVPTVELKPTKSAATKPKPKLTPVPIDTGPWGVAQQIDEHTWTMKIGEDPQMATPKEIFAALNNYRKNKGSSQLTWDDTLASYAQSRADYYVKNNGMDEHKGFIDFLNNQDGFNKLGFDGMGENASYGYKLLGVHLIEWIFAGDKPHDDNQLSQTWAYVGVGVNGTAVDIVFGTGKR